MREEDETKLQDLLKTNFAKHNKSKNNKRDLNFCALFVESLNGVESTLLLEDTVKF